MSSSSRSTAPTLSSPSVPTTAQPVYKGKIKNRSWAQLPPEIIRMICTYSLQMANQHLALPVSWTTRDTWAGRMLFVVLRDQFHMERLMKVCPSWSAALEYHSFWNHAAYALDPADCLINSSTIVQTGSSNAIRPSPCRHFRHILFHSCLICRLNTPFSYLGLGNAKRTAMVPFFGQVSLCRDHHKRDFCGVCLRSPCLPNHNFAQHQEDSERLACSDNEDVDTWPHVFTTCKFCRTEGLWRRMSNTPADREAVGNGPPHWAAEDWETRQVIDTFVDLGEGSIEEVVRVAQEKNWLRRYTRFADIMEQAVASQKYELKLTGATVGYGNDGDDSFDDDNYEFHQRAEESGAKVPACESWVRERILDGHWISPADDYFNQRPPVELLPPAEHPAAWILDEQVATQRHPLPRTIATPSAPTYHLADQLYKLHKNTMREVLLPAMSNIIRRIKLESRNADEAIRRAHKLELEDVVQVLRETWPWVKEQVIDGDSRKEAAMKQMDDSSSSSTKSDGSHTTSPVLSTTTLQTTPSPPPKDAVPASDDSIESIGPRPDEMAAMGMEASSLMRYIPFVPLTVESLPSYSKEAITSAWREACGPLYRCSCSICERAFMQAKAAEAAQNPPQYSYNPQANPYPQTTVNPYPQNPQSYPQPIVPTHDPNVVSPVIPTPSPVISIPPQRQEYVTSNFSDLEEEESEDEDDEDVDADGELEGVQYTYWQPDGDDWGSDLEGTETLRVTGVDVSVEREEGAPAAGFTVVGEQQPSKRREVLEEPVDKGDKGKGKARERVTLDLPTEPLWGIGPMPSLSDPRTPVLNISKTSWPRQAAVPPAPLVTPTTATSPPTSERTPSRKRTSQELEEDESTTGSTLSSSESELEQVLNNPTTPPKRVRREGNYSDVRVDDLNPRLKKRTSRDADAADRDRDIQDVTPRTMGKRARVSDSPEEEVGQRALAEERRVGKGGVGPGALKMLSVVCGSVDEKS